MTHAHSPVLGARRLAVALRGGGSESSREALTHDEGDANARTLPACLLTHAALRPNDVCVEAWSPSNDVVERLTFRRAAERMLSAHLWLRDDVNLQVGHRTHRQRT